MAYVKQAGPDGKSHAMVMGFLMPEMDYPEAEKTIKMLIEAGRIKYDGSKYTAG